jgi:hypothetical protein
MLATVFGSEAMKTLLVDVSWYLTLLYSGHFRLLLQHLNFWEKKLCWKTFITFWDILPVFYYSCANIYMSGLDFKKLRLDHIVALYFLLKRLKTIPMISWHLFMWLYKDLIFLITPWCGIVYIFLLLITRLLFPIDLWILMPLPQKILNRGTGDSCF